MIWWNYVVDCSHKLFLGSLCSRQFSSVLDKKSVWHCFKKVLSNKSKCRYSLFTVHDKPQQRCDPINPEKWSLLFSRVSDEILVLPPSTKDEALDIFLVKSLHRQTWFSRLCGELYSTTRRLFFSKDLILVMNYPRWNTKSEAAWIFLPRSFKLEKTGPGTTWKNFGRRSRVVDSPMFANEGTGFL